jgi:8-oxo-dGTP diphosphatase
MIDAFCPSCGAPFLSDTRLDEEGAEVCTNCGNAHYRQLKVGAAALIEQDGQILLLRRAEDPFSGSWGLPAGFVRWNESPESATVRETEEECGLAVQIQGLFGVYFFDDDPRGTGILIAFRCNRISGTPRSTAEASESRFFSRDDIPNALAGSGQDKAIQAWARGQDPPPGHEPG